MSGLHQVSEVDTAQTGLGEVEDMGGGGDFDNIEGVDGEDFEFSEDGEESIIVTGKQIGRAHV